ncbi:unnamed protein product [Clonostachys byssicola]|uniref:Bacteriophage T5 Orf172 DNA-binding domain-containing protein n=1 Tax=Clonostachys byssicola TaxID=160290 RepID=A0A9N9UGY0_9HYPO|nr:unnamed protein product [Clonostachys byssicola]
MAFNKSQPSSPDPTDIECLKKALGLPSICLATTVNGVQCGTAIPHEDEIDPILSSLLNPSHTTTPPLSFLSHTDQLLSRLLFDPLCPSRSQHSAPSKNMLSLDTLRDRFQEWKLSEEKGGANNEASTAGADGCHESQTSTLGEGFQRDTVHDAAFNTEKDDENDEEDEGEEEDAEDEEDEDSDEDDASSHSEDKSSEYQPSEYEYQPREHQNDKHSKGRTNNALDGKPTEVLKNEFWESLYKKIRHDMKASLNAADDQAPASLTTPPRTSNNSSKSESGSKDEPDPVSRTSTPVPPIFSPPEPSSADTPDTEKTTSPTGRQGSDSYFEESPSLNRGSSARSGKGLSFNPILSLLQPKAPESHNEERPTTPSNSKNKEYAGRGSTPRRGRSVSTDKASARTPLHPSITLPDGTKTAEIYEISAKSNALKEILMTMRSIADGDRAMPGHVYAYKHKSVPGHIKIGFAKDEQNSTEEWHIVLDPVGKHKDLHLWKRLQQQEDKCMSGLEVLFAVYMPHAAGHMERLVHRTLYKEKRIAKCQKLDCDTEHIEWFEVEKKRALEVVMRWAEFSEMFPYNNRGCLGESWDEHAFEYAKQSTPMTLEKWWNGAWNDFRADQKIKRGQQLVAALEEKRNSQQEELNLLDIQVEIQLERNRLKQEKNELEQYATALREVKVKRDLERTRERQQELQQRIEKLSLR